MQIQVGTKMLIMAHTLLDLTILECGEHCLPLSSSEIVFKEHFGEINIWFSIECLGICPLPVTLKKCSLSSWLVELNSQKPEKRENIIEIWESKNWSYMFFAKWSHGLFWVTPNITMYAFGH